MAGFVLLRVRAHRLLLAAALLTVVLTTSVLATFTAFTGAIGDAALRRTLQHQSAGSATVEVQADTAGPDPRALDAAVRKQLGGVFAGLPATVASTTRSGPYGLPRSLRPAGASKSGDPDLTLLATFDRAHLTLAGGAWPAPAARGAAQVQVAIPQAAAQALKVTPGRTITLADRLGGRPLSVRVTGVYRPADPASPYWHLDPLGGRGVHTVAFTTYGPMLADPGSFTSGRVATAAMAWQAAGDFRTVTSGRVDALKRSVQLTVEKLKEGRLTSVAQSSSALPDLLDALRRSMLVTRSTLLIGALQLVILAGFALLLVAQLLADERAGETALLRARGGSRAGVGRIAVAEALLLAVPAAIAAPLLAGPVSRLLAGTGAMAHTGVHLGSGSTPLAWLVAVCAALACAFAVVVPALRVGGTAADRAARARRGAAAGALQAGADVGLLVVAAIAYWQLQRRASGNGALTASSSGGLGVDPVLVAAPALCLLAGTVLVLRLLPLVARLGERRAARGRGLALALAGWQLSRRPRRGAAAALLLVLSVAMGMFAIGQGASWDRSQRDQAQYAVGADVRVTGTTTPPFGQPGIFASVPGITAAAPATREQVLLSGDRHATALVADSATAGRAMQFRSDLTGGRPTADMLAKLRVGQSAGSGTAGIALAATARQVSLTASLRATGGHGRPAAGETDTLSATVLDAFGVPYDINVGDLPPDGARHTLVLDLTGQMGGAGGAPAGPLRLISLSLVYPVPDENRHDVMALYSARVTDRSGAVREVRPQDLGGWGAVSSYDDAALSGIPSASKPRAEDPVVGGRALLTLSYESGVLQVDPDGFTQIPLVTVRMSARTAEPPPLTAVATDSYLKAAGVRSGATVRVQLGGIDLPVRIVHAVRAIPATGDAVTTLVGTASGDPAAPAGGPGAADRSKDAGALLLDLRAVNRVLLDQGGLPLSPTEWWLAVRPGDSARVAAALRDRTDVDTVLVRDEAAAQLRGDPLGAGPQSALPAAVVAAAVLAALGFAVAAAGAVRERTAEFAVLRALGAPRRRLARMLAAEQGLLVLVSLAVGVGLGALLTRMITPLIVLTAQADRPVPDLLVELPPGRLSELIAVVLVVPLLVVAATALRRGDPAAALRRQGED